MGLHGSDIIISHRVCRTAHPSRGYEPAGSQDEILMADGATRLLIIMSLLDDVVVLHGGICSRGMRSDRIRGRGGHFALSRVVFRQLSLKLIRVSSNKRITRT